VRFKAWQPIGRPQRDSRCSMWSVGLRFYSGRGPEGWAISITFWKLVGLPVVEALFPPFHGNTLTGNPFGTRNEGSSRPRSVERQVTMRTDDTPSSCVLQELSWSRLTVQRSLAGCKHLRFKHLLGLVGLEERMIQVIRNVSLPVCPNCTLIKRTVSFFQSKSIHLSPSASRSASMSRSRLSATAPFPLAPKGPPPWSPRMLTLRL
jgi:hypothetical protein